MERNSNLFFTDSKGRLKEKIIYIDPDFIFHSDSNYHSYKKSMIEIEYQNMDILGKNCQRRFQYDLPESHCKKR